MKLHVPSNDNALHFADLVSHRHGISTQFVIVGFSLLLLIEKKEKSTIAMHPRPGE